ncbi:MAG: triose-phosphate isomerase [Acidobacteriota bacterium]
MNRGRTLIAANWKMHKTSREAKAFFDTWRTFPALDCEIAFLPPFTLLHAVAPLLSGTEVLGGQNLHEAAAGAFTGEISAGMLRDAGCKYVLIGHSERRHVFGEPDERIALKVRAALEGGLRPILCVGETLEQRKNGNTLDIVWGQLAADLGRNPPREGFDIAYEPVWAIGTGKVASHHDAREVHEAVLEYLGKRGGGRDCRILYGGSVKPGNALDLLNSPGIHGLLVGGASLDPGSFHQIAALAKD